MNEQQRAVWEKVVELLEDNREYIEADERPEYLALYDKGIADANALLMQPEPVQCWKCGDMNAMGHAKCDVPACGMREQQPASKQDHALEQALTRLQKRYSELEAKVGAQQQRPQNCGTGYCSCIECHFKKGGA